MSDLATFFQVLFAPKTLKRPSLPETPAVPEEVAVPQDEYAQHLFDYETDGVVTDAIVPGRIGQIEYRGGWWSAQSHCPFTLPVGSIVRVVSPPAIPLKVELLYIPFDN